MSIEAAINLISSQPRPRDGLHRSGAVMTVRSSDSAAVWFLFERHRWVDALVQRVGADVFARILDALPNASGLARAVARIELDDDAVRLTKFGFSQRAARTLEKLRPKRRVTVDVSAAEKLPSLFGTKGTAE